MTTNKSRRANGQGYTYKNGKSFRTVITDKGRKVTASGSTAAESRRLAKAKLSSLPVVTGSVVVRDGSITLEQFLLPWLEHVHQKKIAETTYLRYLGLANKFIIPSLGRIALRNVTKKHIKELLESMAMCGQSARSAQQARALLSVAFNYAIEMEIVMANPVKLVKNPSLPPTKRNPLSMEETQTLIKSVSGTFMAARIQIAVICGLRQGEALGLRWADVDLDKKIIHVRVQVQRKNKVRQFVPLKTKSSQRALYVDDSTIELLRAHRAMVNSMRLSAGSQWIDYDLVFPNKFGGFIQSKWDYEKWMRSLDAVGLERRRLHDARHTSGTLLYESGNDIESIRRVLGHSSIALTSRTYVHGSEAPIRTAFNNLDNAIKGA